MGELNVGKRLISNVVKSRGTTVAIVKFAMKHRDKQRTQIMIVTTCMDMALKTLFRMMRARWDIENSIFNNLKSGRGKYSHFWRKSDRYGA